MYLVRTLSYSGKRDNSSILKKNELDVYSDKMDHLLCISEHNLEPQSLYLRNSQGIILQILTNTVG